MESDSKNGPLEEAREVARECEELAAGNAIAGKAAKTIDRLLKIFSAMIVFGESPPPISAQLGDLNVGAKIAIANKIEHLESRIRELETKLPESCDTIHQRFEWHLQKFTEIDGKLQIHKSAHDTLAAQVDALKNGLDEHTKCNEEEFNSIILWINKLEKRLEDVEGLLSAAVEIKWKGKLGVADLPRPKSES